MTDNNGIELILERIVAVDCALRWVTLLDAGVPSTTDRPPV
jgi:hypothetical protein